MKDKFADLEEPKNRALPTVIAAFLLIAGLFTYRLTHIKPIQLSGTVESTVSAASSEQKQFVPVLLEDGTHVRAALPTQKSLSAGDKVDIVEHVQLFAAPSYEIADNSSRSES